jgi:hypothetical protein
MRASGSERDYLVQNGSARQVSAYATMAGVVEVNCAGSPLESQYKTIRGVTRSLAEGLSAEDQMVPRRLQADPRRVPPALQ